MTLVLVVVDNDDNESCRAHIPHVSSLKMVFTSRKVGPDRSFFLPLTYVLRISETFIDMMPLVFTTIHSWWCWVAPARRRLGGQTCNLRVIIWYMEHFERPNTYC